MKKSVIICFVLCLCLAATCIFTACGTGSSSTKDTATEAPSADVTAASDGGIDYMALVNKTHPLPEKWEDQLETVHMTNSVGDDVEVEKKAYEAYLELKAALEKEGVYVDLDSARRSVAEQQRIMDEFTEEKGADYAAKTVAKPGYSEHHTGLALDLYLIIDGKDIVENDDMIKYTDVWAKIHEKLPKYGFILRYLDGMEHITGYGYEPWHIRYLDNADTAKEITAKGVTLEEYLGAYTGGKVVVDCGESERFTEEELNDAVVQIKCRFAFWGNVDLKSIKYAGDEAVTQEKLDWLNQLSDGGNITQAAEFLMDFHTPKETGELTFNPDQDYVDYQWWLARTDEGGWDIVTLGY